MSNQQNTDYRAQNSIYRRPGWTLVYECLAYNRTPYGDTNSLSFFQKTRVEYVNWKILIHA